MIFQFKKTCLKSLIFVFVFVLVFVFIVTLVFFFVYGLSFPGHWCVQNQLCLPLSLSFYLYLPLSLSMVCPSLLVEAMVCLESITARTSLSNWLVIDGSIPPATPYTILVFIIVIVLFIIVLDGSILLAPPALYCNHQHSPSIGD